MLARLRSLARGLFGRARMEQDMAEEFRFHFERRIEDLTRAGVPPSEAARHYTDDGEVCSVELDLLAQDGSGAAETPLPEAVADDGDRMPVERAVVLGG